jgi:hypothetical protein
MVEAVLNLDPGVLSLHVPRHRFTLAPLDVLSMLEKRAQRTVTYNLQRSIAELNEELHFYKLVLVDACARLCRVNTVEQADLNAIVLVPVPDSNGEVLLSFISPAIDRKTKTELVERLSQLLIYIGREGVVD